MQMTNCIPRYMVPCTSTKDMTDMRINRGLVALKLRMDEVF